MSGSGFDTMTSILTLEAVQKFLDVATCPEDVFTGDPDCFRTEYRRLAGICHPDVAESDAKDLAKALFSDLGRWRADAETKIAAGTYGDRKPAAPPKPPYKESELSIGSENYRLVAELGSGTVARVHQAVLEGGAPKGQVTVKISRRPSDNDLLAREFRALNEITAIDLDRDREAFLSTQRVYVPHPHRTAEIRGANAARYRANVLMVPHGRHMTADELRRNPKFRSGVPAAHVYWIYRRLLLTLWMAHVRGYVHGGVNPANVLIYPEAHGLVLIDWTAAARIGSEHVPVIDPEWEAFAAPEVRKKAKAAPATDIYSATAFAKYLAGDGGDLPNAIAEFFERCLDPDPARRPQDAERLHEEFGRMIEKLHGPRKFVELEV